MVRNAALLIAFERQQHRTRAVSHAQNMRLYEAMYRQARRLDVIPGDDPLAGIEHDIHLARLLNVRTTPR